MTKKERINEAVRSFVATVSQNSGDDPRDVLEVLPHEIQRIRQQFNEAPSWTKTEPRPISWLWQTKSLQHPARVRATIIYISEPFMIYLDDPPCQTLVARCRLRDAEGEVVETVMLTNEALIKDIRKAMCRHGEMEFLGQTMAIPSAGGSYDLRFMIFEMRPVTTALQTINATPEEVKRARTRLRTLKRKGETPVAYIRERLIDGLEIASIDDHPALSMALDFTILQSLSCGHVGNASGKLNGLIVGVPGSGKKLLNRAARTTSVNFREGHPTKLTKAGLSGSTRPTKKGFVSEPGLLPLAHMGTVSIQDAHSIPNSSRAGVYAALSMVMEDGVVMDSTAANRTFEAETAVLLDLNRLSDLGRAGKDTHVDIGIPLNVLSRFDGIFVFKADAERQAEVALSLHEKLGRSDGGRNSLDDEEWARECRVLVAYLRDNVEPDTAPVVEEARRRHADLIGDNVGCLALADFQTRMANSVWKIIHAICRGWNRKTADEEVVREAYRLLAPKIEFLKSFDPTIRVPSSWDRGPLGRKAWVWANYAGDDVNPKEAAERYEEETGESVSARTIMRILENLGATKPKRGVYRLPLARKIG